MADAPEILKNEKLRDSYPKLNAAIRNSNEALSKANTAKSTADTALANTEKTQIQLDTVVINGDSSVEAAQARVDADGNTFTTLQERLNNSDAQTYNLTKLPTGEINDASSFIQAILNSAKNKKVRKIKFPKNTYRLNSNLFIETSDLEIDFSGSTLLSYAKSTSNKQGEIGIINPRGSFVETDVDFISYFRSIFSGAHTPPVNSPVLLTYEAIEQISNFEYHVQGKITTSNNSYFNVGDEILLIGWTRPEGFPYVKEKFEPEIRTVAKVLSKDATYIYVDYYSPFKYPSFVDNTVFKSRVHKLNTIKNVTIKNVDIVQMNNIATLNAPTATEKEEGLSGIAPFFVDGLKLENVKVENTIWNAIYPWSCRSIEYNNIHASKPQAWGGGQGYTIQHMGCRDIEAHNITGYQVRHVVDFSCNSHNATVYDSFGIDGKDTTLLLHGMCEHDITYIRCKGMYGTGSGLAGFPNINANIEMQDCDFFFVATTDDTKWVDNVNITNSRIKFLAHPSFLNFSIKDSDVLFYVQNYAPKPNTRGVEMKTKFSIEDSNIILYVSDIVYDTAYILNYDKVIMKDNAVKFRKDSVIRPVVFNIQGVEDLTIKNMTGENFVFIYKNERNPKARIVLDRNNIGLSAANSGFVLRIAGLTNCNLFIDFVGNMVEHTGTITQFFVLDARSSNYPYVNSKVVSNTRDNFFKGNPNALIHYVYTAGDGIVTALDHDNIIQNKAGGALFTSGKHTVI